MVNVGYHHCRRSNSFQLCQLPREKWLSSLLLLYRNKLLSQPTKAKFIQLYVINQIPQKVLNKYLADVK